MASAKRLLGTIVLLLGACATCAHANPAVALVVTDCVPLGAPCPFRPKTPGQPFTFYVVPVDASSQVATAYAGTITILSSDATAILPAQYTFGAGDTSYYSTPFTITINSAQGSGPYPQLISNVFASDTNGLSGTGSFFYLAAPVATSQAPFAAPLSLLVLLFSIPLLARFALLRGARGRRALCPEKSR